MERKIGSYCSPIEKRAEIEVLVKNQIYYKLELEPSRYVGTIPPPAVTCFIDSLTTTK